MFNDVGINPGQITSERGAFIADSLRRPDSDIAQDDFLYGVTPFLDYVTDGIEAFWTVEVPLTPQLLLYKGKSLINLLVEYVSVEESFIYEAAKWVFELRSSDPRHTTGPVIPTKQMLHLEQQQSRDKYQRVFVTLSTMVDLGVTGKLLYFRTLFAAAREITARMRVLLTFNSDRGLATRQAEDWLDGELVRLFTSDVAGNEVLVGWELVDP